MLGRSDEARALLPSRRAPGIPYELAEIIVREMGKPIGDAIGEVEFSAAIYAYYADYADGLLADEPIELLHGEGDAVIRRSPFGVLLGIMPWNFPYYQVARFAGPNLCIGNTILLKHAPQCPESAGAIQQIFDDAGFPEGAYVNVYATNEQAAEIIADPRVAGVSLTGSSWRAAAASASGSRGGTTKPAGVYCSASSIQVTGPLTLDGGGDPTGSPSRRTRATKSR